MSTTFWDDFTIAEAFGVDAVRDTFQRAFDGWKDNAEYLAHLACVMSWKCGQHYERGDEALNNLYHDLYYICHDYAYSGALSEDGVRTYFEITD